MYANQQLNNRIVEKPWGHEIIWAQTESYLGKILFVKAGQSLSLQFHRNKEESMFIDSGTGTMEWGSSIDSMTKLEFKSGDTFHLPPLKLHRISAITDVRIFEVSTCFPDDVVRLEDRYGRK